MQKLIKVSYSGLDTRGIYLYTDKVDEINDKWIKKQSQATYKFVIRKTVTINMKKLNRKEVMTVSGITLYQALQKVIQRVPEFINEIKNPKVQPKVQLLTVKEVWDKFFVHKTTATSITKVWRKSTSTVMTSSFKILAKPYIGNMMVLDVKKADIEDTMTKLTQRGLGASSSHKLLNTLFPMFEWYFEREEIDKRNPCSFKLPALDNKRKVTMNQQEISDLYKSIYNFPDEVYRNILIMLAHGRRSNEVLSLHSDDVDGDYFTITKDKNKAKKDMIYKLPMEVREYASKQDGYVFASTRTAKHITGSALHKQWKKIAPLDFHMHDLRHLIATGLNDSDTQLESISRVLGHTVKSITGTYITDTTKAADMKYDVVTKYLEDIKSKWKIE